MPKSTHKKVIIRRTGMGRSVQGTRGYLEPSQLHPDVPLALLSSDGTGMEIAWDGIQTIYFVIEYVSMESLVGARGRGQAGARLPGLWVRVHSREGWTQDGVLATGLLELQQGIWLSPLYSGGVCQRVFIPSAAAQRLEPLAYVRPRAGIGRHAHPRGAGQFDLFETAPAGETGETA